jgi:hypothetical protein
LGADDKLAARTMADEASAGSTGKVRRRAIRNESR